MKSFLMISILILSNGAFADDHLFRMVCTNGRGFAVVATQVDSSAYSADDFAKTSKQFKNQVEVPFQMAVYTNLVIPTDSSAREISDILMDRASEVSFTENAIGHRSTRRVTLHWRNDYDRVLTYPIVPRSGITDSTFTDRVRRVEHTDGLTCKHLKIPPDEQHADGQWIDGDEGTDVDYAGSYGDEASA